MAVFMYRCEKCNAAVGPHVSQLLVTTQTREKAYPARTKVNRIQRNNLKVRFTDDPGGQGTEAAQRKGFCPDCARRFSGP
jgi:hypothetical protein